jgi:hypothetical protein
MLLSDGIPFHDGFVFLPKTLYFLLNDGYLLLFYCGFVFFGFLVPILYMDLVKLGVALNILYW